MKGEKYFLVWGDYNGAHVETFTLQGDLEARVQALMEEITLTDCAKNIKLIVKGVELYKETVSVASKIRVVEKEEGIWDLVNRVAAWTERQLSILGGIAAALGYSIASLLSIKREVNHHGLKKSKADSSTD